MASFSSEMRSLIDLWEETEKKGHTLDQIKSMLEVNGFVLFFKLDNSLYAAPEESRLTFARMKNPDEETDDEWRKEATFIAVDLDKVLEGEKSERVFNFDNIKKIKVMDQDDIEKQLVKRTSNPKKIKQNLYDKNDEPPNLEPGPALDDDDR